MASKEAVPMEATAVILREDSSTMKGTDADFSHDRQRNNEVKSHFENIMMKF